MQPLKNRKYPGSFLARQRSLARTLHARVYAAADGRLLLVRGNPNAEQMLRYLSHLDQSKSHLITPADLGISREAVDELTDAQLASASHALTKWSRLLEASPYKQRRNDRYRAEVREIAMLQIRLRQHYEWKRWAATAAFAQQSPWLLDNRQETQLARIVDHELASGNSLLRLDWLARLVFWTAGGKATSRFCGAASPLIDESPEVESRRMLRATLAKLHVWHQRAPLERARSIQSEIEHWIAELPPRVVARAGVSAKLKGQSLQQRLEQQISHCKRALRECNDGGRQRMAAALATLVTTDNATAPVPQRLVRYWIDENHSATVTRSIEELLQQCKQPGYDRLLQVMDEMAKPPIDSLRFVREQLCMSQRVEDIEWAIRSELQSQLSPIKLRASGALHIARQMKRLGIDLPKSDLRYMLTKSDTLESFQVLRAVVDWFVALPTALRTPRLSRVVSTSLFDNLLPGLSFADVRQEIRQWNQLVTMPRGLEPCDVQSWTQRISNIQLAMGQPAKLPGKARRLLDAKRLRQREQNYLRNLEAEGVATPLQVARLLHLSGERPTPSRRHLSKTLRAVQDAFAHVALDAFQRAVRQGTRTALVEPLGRLLTTASTRRVMEFADWQRSMTTPERQLLQQLLQAHQHHGSNYKRHLALNRKWLQQARARGMNVDDWLAGGASAVNAGGRSLRIEVASDPMEIFLMGTYFGTCLSLGSANQLAVLANAADANKHVIFVRDNRQRIVARQLITISDQYELLGYYCYVNEASSNQEKRYEVIAAVAEFCARLARRCGISLANSGEPEDLGDHFWYDDGTYEWHAASQVATKPPRRTPKTTSVLVYADGMAESPMGRCVEYAELCD